MRHCLVRFESPIETRAFAHLTINTNAARGVPVEVLMEPSGTYGEGLRALLHARGVSVFMLSPQRVHGAREVFDGVPSLHEAKINLGGVAAWMLMPPNSAGARASGHTRRAAYTLSHSLVFVMFPPERRT